MKSFKLAKQLRTMSMVANNFGFASGKTVGFIGLGNMGGFMAANLAKKGENVIAFDLSADAVNTAKENGCQTASSVAEVAAASDVIITMLPGTPQVEAVYKGDEGIFKNAKPATLFIDSSTISPIAAQKIAKEAQDQGHSMIDAPVSGGVVGASAGTLTFMVGANESSFGDSKGYLELMGKNIFHCGDNGCGQIAKCSNNYLLGMHMVASSEALNLGIKLGMDPKKLTEVMSVSSSRCWSVDTYNPVPGVLEGVPSSREYEGGFMVDLMAKDMDIAFTAAKEVGADTTYGSAAFEYYKELQSEGAGRKDFGYVYKAISEKKN